MNEDRMVVFVKPILDKPVIHTTGLKSNNKLSIVLHKLNVFDIVGYRVPCLTYVILAMDGTHPPAGLFPDLHRAIDGCTVLFGVEMKPLPGDFGDNLEVFDKKIAFLLSPELCPFPSLRDIVHFP